MTVRDEKGIEIHPEHQESFLNENRSVKYYKNPDYQTLRNTRNYQVLIIIWYTVSLIF